jgi:putative ABC transport system substrate-binding protein
VAACGAGAAARNAGDRNPNPWGATWAVQAGSSSAFRQGLGETGYVEGRNVITEYRSAEGHFDRLPALAADLVRRRVNVIFALTTAALSAKAATSTIPIVFFGGVDPVKLGLVATLNRPGGNVTGVSTFTSTLIGKRLELLRELVPGVVTIAFLMNAANEGDASDASDIEIAAHSVPQQIILLNASTDQEIDAAITTAAERRVGALLVNGDTFFLTGAIDLLLSQRGTRFQQVMRPALSPFPVV